MEIKLDELRAKSMRASLKLTDEEIEKLLPKANRSHRQALELRDLLSDEIEPAARFAPVAGK
jgi:hypothetical protein